MAVPYTFAGATSSIPLSQLDTNFASTITLGNTAIQLGNTVTTLNNMTLANVTISSGNVTITNVTVTTANVTVGNITTITGTSATYTNIASGNVTITGGTLNNVAIGGTTAASGAFTTLSASGAFSLTGDQVQISEGGTGQTTANAAFNALAPSQTGNSGKYLKTDGTDTSWDAIDINTADITGTLPILNGGTGQTTANAAFNALAPSQTSQSGKYLKTDGTNASWDALDISTADITGTLPIANGGSGQTTANAALNAFLPSQTSQSGKYLKTDGTNASWDQLDISTADITGTLPVANGGTNATATPTAGAVAYGTGTAYAFTSAGSSGQVLTSGGAGAPTWSSLSSIGVTTFSAGTTGFTPSSATSGAVTLAGTLATTNGGTGLTSFTANRVFYASSTSAIGQSANLTFDGTTLTANALTTTSTVTINGGTANGVAYLNGSKVLTTGSALTFDGTTFNVSATYAQIKQTATGSDALLDMYGQSATTGAQIRAFGSDGSAQYLIFKNGNTEGMRLTSTGLGIGTSTVASKLAIAGFSSANITPDINITRSSSGTTIQSGPNITFADGTTNNTVTLQATQGRFGVWNYGAGSWIERLSVTSAGDVGIGTSSPQSDATYGGLTLNGANGSIFTLRAGGSNSARIYTTAVDNINIDSNGSASGYITFRTGTGSTERMRIDSSGNLGLGVTPSAWSSSRALQILSTSLYNNTANDTFVGSNYYYDGSNNRYINTDFAAAYGQVDGTHRWFTAASGTAGNAISFTQAMTLDASGNLGVGETSPGSYSKFVVQNSSASLAFFYRTSSAGLSIGADNDGPYLATNTYHNLRFFTNGSERARITSGGDVVIGGTTANAKFNVYGPINIRETTGDFCSNNQDVKVITGVSSGTLTTVATLTKPATNSPMRRVVFSVTATNSGVDTGYSVACSVREVLMSNYGGTTSILKSTELSNNQGSILSSVINVALTTAAAVSGTSVLLQATPTITGTSSSGLTARLMTKVEIISDTNYQAITF